MNTFLTVSNPFSDRLNEGGPMMYFVLICLLLALVFMAIAFFQRPSQPEKASKMIKLSIESSLLALVMGCLGSVVGIIQLFDMVEALGNVSPELFSGGLKVSLLTITFGLFSFAIGRLGILIYKWTSKAESSPE